MKGALRNLCKQVEQISFSGPVAREAGQDILFVTERAVFRLQPEGLELIEVAPGIDVQRDVVDRMEFTPIIRSVGEMHDSYRRNCNSCSAAANEIL